MRRKRIFFLGLVEERASTRRFQNRPVDREDILVCLEAARLAPSAENSQPWRFLIIDDPHIKSRFAKEVFSGIYSVSKFAAKAPVIVLVLARLNPVAHRLGKQIQNIQFHLLDIGIAGEHFVLQAQELGLGTCWMGWFNTRKARRFFNILRKYKIIALIAMGYSEEKLSQRRKRRELREIAWFNRIED